MKNTVLLALGITAIVHVGVDAQEPMSLDGLVQRGDVYLHPETFEPFSGVVERIWMGDIPRERGMLKDGKWDGVHEWFHMNGRLATQETYINGTLNGPSESYFKSGNISARETYGNGQLNGPYESYWHRGRLAERGEWSGGEPCGNWLSFGRTIIYPACPGR